jgi:hypothetical protein
MNLKNNFCLYFVTEGVFYFFLVLGDCVLVELMNVIYEMVNASEDVKVNNTDIL